MLVGQTAPGLTSALATSLTLEVLNRALMFFGGRASLEGAEVSALARARVFLPRIETILAGFQFTNHARSAILTNDRPGQTKEVTNGGP